MNRQQAQRAFVVGIIALAGAMIVREVMLRGQGRELLDQHREKVAAASDRYSFVAPELERGDRTELLAHARRLLEQGFDAPDAGFQDKAEKGRRIVFLSLGRSDRPALVTRGEGPNLTSAIDAAAKSLAGRASETEIRDGLLKLDLAKSRSQPEVFDDDGRATLDRSLEGIWLPDPDLLLLPEELLGRRLMTSDGDLQSGRLRRYLDEGTRAPVELDGNPGQAGAPYFRVSFDSIVESSSGSAPKRLYRGNDLTPEVSPESLFEAARSGGEYLLRQHLEDGTFDYSYETKSNESNDDYNLLRHAGTCYSLVELYQVTDDPRYLDAARRGMEWLWTKVREPLPEDAGAGFSAVVSPGKEAKLGGAALALLALVQMQTAAGDSILDGSAWEGQLPLLARFLLFQQGEDGRFASKYFYGEPDPEPFESIYYPGEAILALMRLYGRDPQPQWLEAARRGADWLIDVRDAGKSTEELPHDHWLLMALEELHSRTSDDRYLEHAERIAAAIVGAQRTAATPVDWVGTFYDPPRSTPTATRGEALVAMYRLAAQNDRDTRPYLAALLRMASFQRRCQLTPENVLYLPRPDRALGGFRRSLTNWEVRIDYVQHNLSALLGLRSILIDL